MSLLPKSLHVRLVLMAAFAISISVSTLGGYIAYQQRNEGLQAAYQEALALVTSTAAAVTSDLIIKNYVGIEQTVKLLATHRSITNLRVVNGNNTIVIQATHQQGQELSLSYGGTVQVPAGTQLQSSIAADHITVWAPIQAGSLLGWVQMNVSLADIKTRQAQVLQSTVLAALISIIISIAIISLLLRRPIRYIRQATRFASTLPTKHQKNLALEPSTTELKNLIFALNSAAETLFSQDKELQLLNSLIEYSADPVFILDPDDKFRLLFVNNAACQHFGLSKERLLTTSFSDWTCDADQAQMQSLLKKLAESKHLLFDAYHKTATADKVPVEVSANYILHNGKPLLAGYFSDISQRKQMENALRASEQRLQEIIDVMPIAVFVKDAQSRIMMMNNACEAQWGISFSQLHNTVGDHIFPPEQIKAFLMGDRQVFANGAVLEVEESVWNFALQTQRIMHTYKKPVFDKAEQPLYLIGISVDITEAKQQEENLKEAKLEAEKANHAKSEFLANMSHEIRTPMNAILGFSSILYDIIEDQVQRHYLESIKASSKTLLQLINDILDLSKIEAGKFQLNYDTVALKPLFAEISSVFMQKLTDKSLDFKVKIADDMPDYLILDEIRLRQVLLNLLGNAVKFTHQGFIHLTASMERVAVNRVDLLIKLEDSGIGIAEDQQQKIFSAFTQQENQSLKYGGTGLGLTITKRLLDLMHGQISVSSKVNVGSCFSIKLPNIEEVSAQELIVAPDPDVGCFSCRFQPAKILIVDDIAINRSLIKSYLQDQPDLEFIEAENGQQAFDLAAAHRPDLIFMDRRMPGETGDQVCQRIREQAKLAQIPIIMITASILAPHEQPGVYDLQVNKPLIKAKLLEAMQLFLRHDDNLQEKVEQIIAEASDQPLENRQQLYAVLQADYSELINSWCNSEILNIDAMIDLGQVLLDLAEHHHCEVLKLWARQLMEQAELFDLASLKITLKNFAQLLAELKS